VDRPRRIRGIVASSTDGFATISRQRAWIYSSTPVGCAPVGGGVQKEAGKPTELGREDGEPRGGWVKSWGMRIMGVVGAEWPGILRCPKRIRILRDISLVDGRASPAWGPMHKHRPRHRRRLPPPAADPSILANPGQGAHFPTMAGQREGRGSRHISNCSTKALHFKPPFKRGGGHPPFFGQSSLERRVPVFRIPHGDCE
jgi:hypothetical protein